MLAPSFLSGVSSVFLAAVLCLVGVEASAQPVRLPTEGDASSVGSEDALGRGVLSGGSADSVRRVGLHEALRLFVKNNLSLQRARSEARSFKGEAKQAEAYPNPTIQTTHEPVWRSGNRQSETYLNVSQRVDWADRSARIEAARQASAAARARAAADSAQLALQVAEAYTEAATVETRLRRLKQVTRVFRRADSSMADRETEGDASGYAVRRIRLERARYEQRLAAARLEAESARRTLARMILPGKTPSVAAEPLPSAMPPPVSKQEALRESLRQRPELRRWRSEVGARQATVRAARREVWPDPSLTAGYKRQSDGFEGLFLGVGIDLPLFNRNQGYAEAASARLQAAQTQQSLARREIQNEVRRSHEAYMSSRRQMNLLEGDLLAGADDLLRIAQVSYDEGEMSLVELLDAADAYRDARLRTVDLRADLWKRYFELLRAMGRPLSLP
ncbi:TolC family protein [Salinibacter sp.]|uniref:TolC family protein n=1 Tax=Salinibacter sp. TaxID=2065818 RepID=UPI0021E702D4|nr:TolC family protein [Salinibacter sp.]